MPRRGLGVLFAAHMPLPIIVRSSTRIERAIRDRHALSLPLSRSCGSLGQRDRARRRCRDRRQAAITGSADGMARVAAVGQMRPRARDLGRAYTRDDEGRSQRALHRQSRLSPNVRISMPSTVGRRDRHAGCPPLPLAGLADVLAAGLIRDNLQARLALARVCEQPPSRTPTSLPVRTSCSSARARGDEAAASGGEAAAAGRGL
jgi:hypothetical protein